jgi:hypothetical protein
VAGSLSVLGGELAHFMVGEGTGGDGIRGGLPEDATHGCARETDALGDLAGREAALGEEEGGEAVALIDLQLVAAVEGRVALESLGVDRVLHL